MFCYGEEGYNYVKAAWSAYLASNKDVLDDLGVAIDNAEECWAVRREVDLGSLQTITSGTYSGQFSDSPPPALTGGAGEYGIQNVLIPKKWMRENPEKALALFKSDPILIYFAFGTGTEFGQDQANSLSEAHRTAGAKMYLANDDSFYSGLFQEMYDSTDKTNFPGFVGSNHAAIPMQGPRKDDWTKACPMEWTQKERAERCISVQEAIYGTERLQRLETIKRNVDPKGMFSCRGCIGDNYWANLEAAGMTPEDSTMAPAADENSASSASHVAQEAFQLLLVSILSIKLLG